jgi:hypothetical protein
MTDPQAPDRAPTPPDAPTPDVPTPDRTLTPDRADTARLAPPSERSGDALGVGVRVDRLDDHQGQPSLRIATPAATYVFHEHGGGFASLLDPDGHDWIAYRPGDGPRGAYRGLPNLVHPGVGFHPGGTMCTTRLISHDPDHAIVESIAPAPAPAPGRERPPLGERAPAAAPAWATRWTFTRDAAEMTLTHAAAPYWLLYEGTIGGDYDEAHAWSVDSQGTRRPATQRWEQRLPDPRWVYFATSASPFVLWMIDRTARAEGLVDSCWSMDGAMIVFGMGRTLEMGDRWRHLTEVPAGLSIGIARRDDEAALHRRLDALARQPDAASGDGWPAGQAPNHPPPSRPSPTG